MAIFHDVVTIESAGVYPSVGALLGNRASAEVFDSINNRGYSSIFGSEFDHLHKDFYDKHVRPMEALNFEISRTVNALINPDRFRLLTSIDDFKSIPPVMEMAILLYEPVRQGFVEGRIEGFGYNPDSLPEEDAYGRLIDNFTCEDVAEASDEDGWYSVSGTLYSDDPELDDNELYAIRRTREYIRDHVLAKTDRDPTAIALPRG